MILSKICAFLFKKSNSKLSSVKWRQFCLGLNVLKSQSNEILTYFFSMVVWLKAISTDVFLISTSQMSRFIWKLETCNLGLVSISDKTSYYKISHSLEAARFVFRTVRSLWNFTGTSAALLPMCLLNLKVIRIFLPPISRSRLCEISRLDFLSDIETGPWKLHFSEIV